MLAEADENQLFIPVQPSDPFVISVSLSIKACIPLSCHLSTPLQCGPWFSSMDSHDALGRAAERRKYTRFPNFHASTQRTNTSEPMKTIPH